MEPDSTVPPAAIDPAAHQASSAQSPQAGGARWQGLAPHRLKRVLACIDARLSERIHVGDLAREANMSVFHFSRMFKRATGHSPHQYVTLRRIERARHLLAATSLPIAQIARQVGFRTQPHFTGVFAQHAGSTPKAYRMAHVPFGAVAADAARPGNDGRD
jgi:AraC family transcriptional regulator